MYLNVSNFPSVEVELTNEREKSSICPCNTYDSGIVISKQQQQQQIFLSVEKYAKKKLIAHLNRLKLVFAHLLIQERRFMVIPKYHALLNTHAANVTLS